MILTKNSLITYSEIETSFSYNTHSVPMISQVFQMFLRDASFRTCQRFVILTIQHLRGQMTGQANALLTERSSLLAFSAVESLKSVRIRIRPGFRIL